MGVECESFEREKGGMCDHFFVEGKLKVGMRLMKLEEWER